MQGMNEEAIIHLKKVDSRLAKVIDTIGPLSISTPTNPFLFIVREIVGQMISAPVKRIIFNRLLEIAGGDITPSSIHKLSPEQIKKTGLSFKKANYIWNLSKIILSGQFSFDSINNLSDSEVIKSLIQIRGVGKWTAKMYLIFYLQRQDVLPYEDGAFMQSFKWLYDVNNPSISYVERRARKWKPYSSIAARYLYIALDSGLTKNEIGVFLSSNKPNSLVINKSQDYV